MSDSMIDKAIIALLKAEKAAALEAYHRRVVLELQSPAYIRKQDEGMSASAYVKAFVKPLGGRYEQ